MKFGIEFVFAGIWLCLSFPQIEAAPNITGNGNILFEIEILLFDNPTGTVFRNNDVNDNRETCDISSLGPNYCDTFFRFCVGRENRSAATGCNGLYLDTFPAWHSNKNRLLNEADPTRIYGALDTWVVIMV